MTLALVTGGTGFIGSHLVEALLSQGVEVRCLVRSRRQLRWLKDKDVELVEGDCAGQGSLQPAVKDVDYIYHAAGVLWAASEKEYFRNNVVATRNLIEACGLSCPGLQRFVFVSSQAAAGPGSDARPRTESDPPTPITPYGESKLAAEQIIIEHKNRVSAVIVRPCAVYGPRDRGFLAYFRIVRRGFLLEFGRGEDRIVSLCHVGDIVSGIIRSAHSQVASGSVYFLADSEPYSWHEVEIIIQRTMGISAKHLRIPSWLLAGLGTVGQGYGLATGKFVMLNKSRVAELMARRWGCDISKARNELGFVPETKLKDGLRDVIRWYKKEQWL
jgi:nucleoside-diphosphate-sugar epimerase